MRAKVLFLCTGNYYRSRFAETLFNHEAKRHGLDWSADSCGLEISAGNVGAISAHSRERLQKLDIPLGENLRFPRQVNEDDLRSSQLVIALDRTEHEPMMWQRHPAWAKKIEYWDVADLGFTPADDALGMIERQIKDLVERLDRK